jgi:phosphate transport system permease protein
MKPKMIKKLSVDKMYRLILIIFGSVIVFIVLGIIAQLIIGALPSIKENGLMFLFKKDWDPNKNSFGALPFIYGTMATSFLSVSLAAPLAIGTALYLNEYIKPNLSLLIGTLIDLLAAIPSVVYGLWGLIIMVPYIKILEIWLHKHLGFIPLFKAQPYGVGILSATFILMIMILPYAISVIKEVLKLVPVMMKEQALALGATKWEVLQKVVIPYIRSGIFAGIGLSLGRALGETMAVTMLIGNRNSIPTSIFDPANTLASIIANDFYEASSKLHVSSLIYMGLISLTITLVITLIMKLILTKLTVQTSKK